MSKAAAVGSENFDAEVLNSDEPVLVDFWATWCPPCRALSPVIDRVAEKYAGRVKVVKVDTDQNPELSEKYGVQTIPNLTFFKGGEVVGQAVGYVSENDLSNKLDTVLAS